MAGDTFLFHHIQRQLDDAASMTLTHPWIFSLSLFSCLHPLLSQAGKTHLVTCPDEYRHNTHKFLKILVWTGV